LNVSPATFIRKGISLIEGQIRLKNSRSVLKKSPRMISAVEIGSDAFQGLCAC
jgi:hypothetical protein